MVYRLIGLMVVAAVPAQAAERWPEGPCRDLKAFEQSLDTMPGSKDDQALAKIPLVILQGAHCGMDVRAKLDALRKVASQSPPAR
jgi:hypothetical protein